MGMQEISITSNRMALASLMNQAKNGIGKNSLFGGKQGASFEVPPGALGSAKTIPPAPSSALESALNQSRSTRDTDKTYLGFFREILPGVWERID